MTALEGGKLEDVGDVMLWERAAAVYGRVQRACMERVRDLHALGCPTRGLAPLIVGLGMFQPRLSSPEVTQRLERAYLAPFAGLAPPERLLEALRLAGPLSFVDMAVRYRGQRPSVVRLHPWMRDLVPHTLRLALAQLDTEEGTRPTPPRRAGR